MRRPRTLAVGSRPRDTPGRARIRTTLTSPRPDVVGDRGCAVGSLARRDGQLDAEPGAAARRVLAPDAAAEAARGLGDDAEAQAAARERTAGPGADEPLEDPVAVGLPARRSPRSSTSMRTRSRIRWTVTARGPRRACRSALSKRLTRARPSCCLSTRTAEVAGRPAVVPVTGGAPGRGGSARGRCGPARRASTCVSTWVAHAGVEAAELEEVLAASAGTGPARPTTRSSARWVAVGHLVAAALDDLDAGDEGGRAGSAARGPGRRRTGRPAGCARRGPRPCC